MAAFFIILLIVNIFRIFTLAHDFAVCYKTGPQLWVVVLLQGHQHTDNLSCDEGIIDALLGHRLKREPAVHLHGNVRICRLQQLHELSVGIVNLGIHEPHLIKIKSVTGKQDHTFANCL